MKGYEMGDSIRGHRIIAEARKISDPVVIVKSARHKARRVVLTENAIEKADGALRNENHPTHWKNLFRFKGDYLFYVCNLRLWNRPGRHRGRLRQGLPLRRLRACLQGLRIQDYLPPLQFSQHQEGEVAFLGGFIKLQLPLLAII